MRFEYNILMSILLTKIYSKFLLVNSFHTSIRNFRTNNLAKKINNVKKSKSPPVTRVSISLNPGSMEKNEELADADRPFTLPPGNFKPKQSLGQNFLSDQNYVLKIVNALADTSKDGKAVVELGPGPGALSRVLVQRYPRMTAIELDQRAVAFLKEKLPDLNVIHKDVLSCDWPVMAEERGTPLSIIGNLPFYITSQILFSLADSYKAIDKAVVTMQYEVAERIVAKPNTKQYGILSVVFQLYGNPKLNFKIPASVFFPKPKVDAALITIYFQQKNPALNTVNGDLLRKVITAAFRQRRKMLRQSLKDLVASYGKTIPDKWSTRRPESLEPLEFISLTKEIFGSDQQQVNTSNITIPPHHPQEPSDSAAPGSSYRTEPIWRKALELNNIVEQDDY